MLTLTPIAATKVKELLAEEGRDDIALRVAVSPGGWAANALRPSTSPPCAEQRAH